MKRHILHVAALLAILAVLTALTAVFMPAVKPLVVLYPFDDSLFPRDMASPTFFWKDDAVGISNWSVKVDFAGDGKAITARTDTTAWTPDRTSWESIKTHSNESDARVIISGNKRVLGFWKTVSRGRVTIRTSQDEVGAPIFYRAVPLPFKYALENMDMIRWCLGDVSSYDPPKVVLENMLMCGNCHSFSADGSVIGMDVDYANDKGSYVIASVQDTISLSKDNVITWSDYRREDGELTFGLLSQVSPNGRYVMSTVKDRSVFVPVSDLYYSQLFFPLKGILVYYDRTTGKYTELSGADDKRYVQSNPSWSPDGRYIVFARNEADSLKSVGNRVVLDEGQCEEYFSGGKKFRFDLYRVPFNNGKGGEAEPIPGASGDGKSNYFARFSPDGKYIVFCKSDSFMLLRPDSRLYIMPSEGGEPRELNANTDEMNSWHSWSPNGRWLIFSSKKFTPYTQLFLTHIDENGNDSPPVMLDRFIQPDRAANIPEFVNLPSDSRMVMHETFVDYYSYMRKGDEQALLGQFEKAVYFFTRSIELNPDFALAHRNLADVYVRMMRFEDANREWTVAIKLDPNDPITHSRMGTFYLNISDFDTARSEFLKSLALQKNNAPALEGMGILAYRRQNLDEARKYLEAAVAINPELADSYYRLGTIYLANHEQTNAERAFRATLAYMDDPQASILLASILMDTNRQVEAITIIRESMKTNPRNGDLCFMLGKLLARTQSSIDEAISLYVKGLSFSHDNGLAYAELGNLYLKVGNKNSAIKSFEKALSLNPNATDLRLFIERLKLGR